MTRAGSILQEAGKTKYNSLTDDELLKVFRKSPKDSEARMEIKKRNLQDHPLIKGKLQEATKLSVPQQQQLKIAKSTLKMSNAGAKIMGGMTKEEAKKFLKSIGWSDAKISQLEK